MDVTEKVKSIGNVLTSTMLRKINEAHKRAYTPITMDDKEYLVMIMHPRSSYLLKVLCARVKWHHEQWVKRYNKWRASRGESVYQEIEGEFGTW